MACGAGQRLAASWTCFESELHHMQHHGVPFAFASACYTHVDMVYSQGRTQRST